MTASLDRGQIDELRRQAARLEFGSTRVALLEEAVRLADLSGDVALAYDARAELIKAAVFAGFPEKAMVAFSWSLAQHDRKAVERPEREILWDYKYIINSISNFPQIGRDQITGALADFERRVKRSGLGMRPVHKLRHVVAYALGDFDESEAAYKRWKRSPRSELSDCPACDLDAEIWHLANLSRHKLAVARAAPLVAGTMSCTVIPHSTLARLLLPLLRLGRVAEAMAHHRRGYQMIARNPYFIEQAAQHIEFLALTGNLPRGVKLFETHLPRAFETFELTDRFRFLLAGELLFDRLQASGKATLRVRLPASVPPHDASGRYELGKLMSWIASETGDLARRFDARNGNDKFVRWIETNRGLTALATPFPFKAPSRSNAGEAS